MTERPTLLRRLRRLIQQPADIPLALRLGWFIWRAPADMEVAHLADMLNSVARQARPAARSPQESYDRIIRLSGPWLRLPGLRARSTCYLRALLLYRFLDPAGRPMTITYAVEPGAKPSDRLRGHAWTSVDGQVYGLDDPTIPARSRPIYVHPPTPARPRQPG